MIKLLIIVCSIEPNWFNKKYKLLKAKHTFSFLCLAHLIELVSVFFFSNKYQICQNFIMLLNSFKSPLKSADVSNNN